MFLGIAIVQTRSDLITVLLCASYVLCVSVVSFAAVYKPQNQREQRRHREFQARTNKTDQSYPNSKLLTAVQQNCHRPVVDQLHLHQAAKAAARNFSDKFTYALNEIFI